MPVCLSLHPKTTPVQGCFVWLVTLSNYQQIKGFAVALWVFGKVINTLVCFWL